MIARLTLSLPLLFFATFAAAFAPAPIYKQPPKATYTAFQRAMQGTWSRSLNSKAKGPRGARVRIDGKTWTNGTSGPKQKGEGGRGGIAYNILLDTSRDPVVLDLEAESTSRVRMRGIIKIEGERLIFCYTTSPREEDRPKSFSDTETVNGLTVRTMTLTRVEVPPTSP